ISTHHCRLTTASYPLSLHNALRIWNVTWSSNGVVVATHPNVAGPNDTLSVTPLNANPNTPLAHTFTVSALKDANCTANSVDLTNSAVAPVRPPPTAHLSGPTTTCND